MQFVLFCGGVPLCCVWLQGRGRGSAAAGGGGGSFVGEEVEEEGWGGESVPRSRSPPPSREQKYLLEVAVKGGLEIAAFWIPWNKAADNGPQTIQTLVKMRSLGNSRGRRAGSG